MPKRKPRTPEDAGPLEAQIEAPRKGPAELAAAADPLAPELRGYRELVSLAGDGYVVTDRAGLVHEASGAVERLLGVSPESLVGRPLPARVAKGHRREFRRHLLDLRAAGEPLAWETVFTSAAGAEVPVAVRAVAVRDAQEEVVGIRWLLRDITRRRQAEQELLRYRDHLEQLVEERTREVEASRAELALRNQVRGAFLTMPDDRVFPAVLDFILEAMDSPYGTFCYVNEEGEAVSPALTVSVWDDCRIPDKRIAYRREEWGGSWGRALVEAQSNRSDGPLQTPEGHVPITRVLNVPIVYGGQAIGLINVANRATPYTEADQEFLEGICTSIAPILHARLRRDAEERVRVRAERQLGIRNRIAHAFLTVPDEDVYGEVLDIVLEVLASEFGVFGYVNEEGAMVCPSMTRGIWDQCQVPHKDIVFPRDQWTGAWGRCLTERRSVRSEGPLRVPEGHVPLSRVLAVPILYGDEAIGQLVVANKPTPYTDGDQGLLEGICTQIAAPLRARLERDARDRARQQAEHDVRLARDRAQSYLDVAGVMFLALDTKGCVTLANRRCCEVLGRTEAEVVGASWFRTFLPARERARVWQAFQEAVATEVPPYFENRVLTASGQERLVAWRNTVLRDEEGRVVGTLSSGDDVTEQRATEAKQRAADERLRMMAEHAPIAMAELDRDLRFEWVVNIPLGLSEEGVLHRTVAEVIPGAAGAGMVAAQREALQTGTETRLQSRVAGEQGDRHVQSTYVPVLGPDGEVTGLLAFLYDITELKEAEEALHQSEARYRELVDNANSVVLRLDAHGRIAFLNHYGEWLFGWSEAEALGRRAVELLVPELDSAGRPLRPVVAEAVTHPEDHELNINENITRDGRRLWMAWSNRALRDPDGTYVGHLAIGVDVTDRVRAETELRETRDLLQNLLDYANAPVIVWDPELRITLFNHAFERLTQRSAEEVLGRPIDLLFPDEARQEALAHIRRAIEGERWETVEIPIACADGDVRTVLWNSATLRSPTDGTVVATIAQGHDITERKAAETQLRDTRDLLQNLLDYANAPVIVWDPELHITLFNHAFERLTQRSAEEVLGRPIDLLFPDEAREGALAHIRRAMEGERWETVEIPIARADGEVRTVLWNSATLRAADGEAVVATIAQGHDITARKAAEADLRDTRDFLQNLLDYANAPVIVWDPDLRITLFNHAFERLTQRSAEEVLGRPIDLLFPDEGREEALAHIRRAAEGERWETVEIPIARADGEVRTVLWNSATLRAADGATVIATIAQGHDITERTRAEAELQQTVAELARSNADLQQFASVASHDLGEPLRMVTSYVQLLERRYRGQLDAEADEFIGYAVDGAARMQTLIDDLLTYSRVGTRGREPGPTDANEVLRQTLVVLGPALDETSAVVTHDPLPVVHADATQLGQVFQNLLANAIKFRSDAPPQVHVRAQQHEDGWVLCVQDNGIGIPPEYGEKVFEVFQRLHGRSEYPGTGIGLAICKRIVERHGGRIWFEPGPDNGTTFHFTLPAEAGGTP